MVRGWKKHLLYSVIIIIIGTLTYILIETVRVKNTGFETKTLWDWMDLLIIPFVLSGGAILLNRSERNTEREIALDRQQEAALQTYFDHMSELLLKNKLRTTQNAEVRDIARTRTLSVMRALDKRRKNLVVQFLREAKLIIDKNSILNDVKMNEIDLHSLDLREAFLQNADLKHANLQDVDLTGADLQGADLSLANLRGAKLFKTNLLRANLYKADLQGADLLKANLQEASLREADLKNASLAQAFLLFTDLSHANLQSAALFEAYLTDAYLVEAHLQGAYLKGANLQNTHLQGADFKGAYLIDADLMGALNISKEQLASAKSLKNTTMPDGTRHN